MGFFKKRPDPITDRSRALSEQIAALEAQITQLSSKAQKQQSRSRPRSGVPPRAQHGQNVSAPLSAGSPPSHRRDPVFESVDQNAVTTLSETETTPAHYNDLGVRKYDLLAVWRRVQNHLHGPATPNPKLVSYLAAGTIKGLRPLRYEKRVARNRFIFFAILLLFVIWIVLSMLSKQF
jgi:hypothetical protein